MVRWRRLLIGVVLSLIGAASGGFWLLPREASPPLLPWPEHGPAKLTLEAETGPTVVLRRHPRGWRFEEPFHWPADPGAIERLKAFVAQHPDPITTTQPGATLRQRLGLDPPRGRLQIQGHTLDLGDTAPLKTGLTYAARDGAVYLVPDTLHRLLQNRIAGLASRRLIPYAQPLTALRIGDYRVRRVGSNWRLEPSTGTNPEAVEAVRAAWREARATAVAWQPPPIPRSATLVAQLRGRVQPLRWMIDPGQPRTLINPDTGLIYRVSASTWKRLTHLGDRPLLATDAPRQGPATPP
jgi:hypothetical protein